MSFPPVQKLILYSASSSSSQSHQQQQIQHLKSSLSSTLQDFLPLAGKLVYYQSTGAVEIDLSSPSFTFIVAESHLDLHRHATDDTHDLRSFLNLVPPLDVTVLPFPAFVVQVTRFGCGGLAIGYSVHHAVVDGKGMMQFMEAWASTCKATIVNGGKCVSLGERHGPSYDRAVIQHPNADEIAKQILQTMVPHLPKTMVHHVESLEEDQLRSSRRTFVLDKPSILSLKQRATHLVNGTSRAPSTYTVISAYTWACYVRAKAFAPTEQTGFVIPMDCRTRLNPPIQEDYFANCLHPIFAMISVSELIAEDGLIRACKVISEVIDRASKDPLHDFVNWAVNSAGASAPSDRFFGGTASPRFRVYEIDFGWGKPARFETLSMEQGQFTLVGGKVEGTVQLSIAMQPDQIEAFAQSFLSGWNAS